MGDGAERCETRMMVRDKRAGELLEGFTPCKEAAAPPVQPHSI